MFGIQIGNSGDGSESTAKMMTMGQLTELTCIEFTSFMNYFVKSSFGVWLEKNSAFHISDGNDDTETEPWNRECQILNWTWSISH